jgi:hypothetical protein
MSFSATEWRARMAYYDATYNNVSYYWSSLGGAMVRTYYLAQAPFYNGLTLYYRSSNYGIDGPVVEPFTSTGNFTVYYTVADYFSTEFGYNYSNYYSGYYYNSSWSFYYGQNSYSNTVMYWYNPGPSFYSYYYSGFPYSYFQHSQQYNAVYSALGASPNTFYNYAYGPYLSYYRYSLSAGNGPYTNYPRQYISL